MSHNGSINKVKHVNRGGILVPKKPNLKIIVNEIFSQNYNITEVSNPKPKI